MSTTETHTGAAMPDLPAPYYQDKRCTIYNAPCEQILPFLEPVDLVLTDPPYGIGESSKKQATRSMGNALADQRDYGEYDWDQEPPPTWLVGQAVAKGKHAIVWGGNHLGLSGGSCWLFWDKDNGQNDFADGEIAWTNLPGAVRRFKWKWQGMLQERAGADKEVRYHETQKPVALFRWAITKAPDDVETILDPFAGSGTTAIAALREGKKVILIERERKYCQVAVDRLQNEPVGYLC